MYSARRIFIAGSDNAASSSIDALASHTQHLNTASSPALEVTSSSLRSSNRGPASGAFGGNTCQNSKNAIETKLDGEAGSSQGPSQGPVAHSGPAGCPVLYLGLFHNQLGSPDDSSRCGLLGRSSHLL